MPALTKFQGKNIVVYGLGITGIASAKALSSGGAQVIAWDDNAQSREEIADIESIIFAPPEKIHWENMDALVLSAGIPFTHPQPHPVVGLAQKAKCPIICDIELLYQQVPEPHYIGITGTNGKSTTTALIGHVLKAAGVEAEIGGNIGVSGVDFPVLSKSGAYVLEMSSFQLDLIQQTRFNMAILLNITPDHLDRHGDMNGYMKAKKRIFMNQQAGDLAIISIDDPRCQEIYDQLEDTAHPARLIPISCQHMVPRGIYCKDGILVDDMGGENAERVDFGRLANLPGQHNAQNIAVSYVVAKCLGVDSAHFIQALMSFEPLPHRLQKIADIDHITYVNDSKATNADATAPALNSYKHIYWIAGGQSKDGGIEALLDHLDHVEHVFLIGKSAEDFAQVLEGRKTYTISKRLEQAVIDATAQAKSDGHSHPVVLLSPACASFDQWPNFMARGDAFIHYVETLKHAS